MNCANKQNCNPPNNKCLVCGLKCDKVRSRAFFCLSKVSYIVYFTFYFVCICRCSQLLVSAFASCGYWICAHHTGESPLCTCDASLKEDCRHSCFRVHKYAQICMNIHKYAQICTNVHKYAKICKNIQKYAKICKKYAKICTNVHKYAQICMSMPLIVFINWMLFAHRTVQRNKCAACAFKLNECAPWAALERCSRSYETLTALNDRLVVSSSRPPWFSS